MSGPGGSTGKGGGDGLLREAHALQQRGDAPGAVAKYKSFLSKHADHPQAGRVRAVCAQALHQMNRMPEALDVIGGARERDLDDPDVCYVLAQVNYFSGNMDTALSAARRAAELGSDRGPFVGFLITVLQYKGEFDEAARVLDAAWARGMDAPELDSSLAMLAMRLGREEEAIDRITRRLKGGIADPNLRTELGFYLADLLDRTGDYRGAWDAVTKANAFSDRMRMRAMQQRGLRAPSAADFVHSYMRRARATVETLDEPTLSALAPGEEGPEPREDLIFVCGMPRSGTTLVEQILSAHPEAESSGEPAIVAETARSVGFEPKGMARVIESSDPSDWSDAGRAIREAERALAGGARVVVDKQPENDIHAGFLAACAPGASVLLMRRDPRDVAISCYFRNFVMSHEWSTSMWTIMGMQRARLLVHEHWLKLIGEHAPWLNLTLVEYERLVGDPEDEARRLVSHCGLDWDDACLRFAERDRLVTTLLPHQAKQGVYTDSVSRWERYAEFIDDRTHKEMAFQVERFGFAG
jgi:hypothetical protein